MNGDVQCLSDEDEKVEALKSEMEPDDKADQQALRALERERAAILRGQRDESMGVRGGGKRTKRKRGAPAAEEDRDIKRRRQQPCAVLIDTGKMKTTVTTTSLMNLKQFTYLSSSMAFGLGPSMRTQKGACAMARLDSRYLLVLGGNAGASSFATTEVLDLKSMAFQPGPQMRTRRSGCSAAMLDTGRLIVIGGYDGFQYLDSTEVLNLQTNEFSPGPKLNTRRAAAAVTMLDTGHLIVVGGKNSAGCTDATEVLDVGSGGPLRFTPGPKMRVQRGGATLAKLAGNRFLVIGGHDEAKTHDSTEILQISDPTSLPPAMGFSQGPAVASPRSYFAAVMLNPGYLHIIGGHDGRNCLETTEVLRVSTMEFSSGPHLTKGRFMCTAATIQEGQVLVVGGTDGTTDHHTSEVLAVPTYSFMKGAVDEKFQLQ